MLQLQRVLITICVFAVHTVVLSTVSIKQFGPLFEIATLALDKEWCGGKITNNRNREPEKWRTSELETSQKIAKWRNFELAEVAK